MINAFLLAWLSHLTTKILADLKFHLFGPDAVMEIFNPPKPEKEVTSENNRNGNRTHDNEKNAKVMFLFLKTFSGIYSKNWILC